MKEYGNNYLGEISKRLKYKSIIVMKSKLNNDIPLLSYTSKAKFQCTKICRATNGPPATKGPTNHQPIIMKSNSAYSHNW